MITGKFKIIVNGVLTTYTNYNDIPERFDNIIEFIPTFPEGPHTEEEHDSMSIYNQLLQELMKRETNARSD